MMTESEFLKIANQYFDFDNPLKWSMVFNRRTEHFRAIARQQFFKVTFYGRVDEGVESWAASIDCDRLILVETPNTFGIPLKDVLEDLRSQWEKFLQDASFIKREKQERSDDAQNIESATRWAEINECLEWLKSLQDAEKAELNQKLNQFANPLKETRRLLERHRTECWLFQNNATIRDGILEVFRQRSGKNLSINLSINMEIVLHGEVKDENTELECARF